MRGLIPKPEVSERIFEQIGSPAYDWKQLEDLTTDKPRKNTTWKPLDPTGMYVSCLSWVAYPYGIPAEDQPCPFYKAKKTTAVKKSGAEEATSSSSSSSSSKSSSASSSSSSSSSSSDGSQAQQADIEEVQRPVLVKEVAKVYGWTGH